MGTPPAHVSRKEVLDDEEIVMSYASMFGSRDDIESPWSRKAILSLDGGGVRGYSSLLIIKELMGIIAEVERTANPEATSSLYCPQFPDVQDNGLPPMSSDIKLTSRYRPCHYFDYIAGTSTGGLIAIILGRLRWSIDDCIKEYERLSEGIFQKPSWLKMSSTNHNEEARGADLKDEFESLNPSWPSPSEGCRRPVLFQSDPLRCRTIVCSMESKPDDDSQTQFLFRSYHQPRPRIPELDRPASDSSTPNTFAIWQVARATSAAPFYSKPFRLDDHRYYDAATELNNPCWEVVKEINLLARGHVHATGILLSVGGGYARVNKLKPKFWGESLEQDMMDISDDVHGKVRGLSEYGFEYYRLNVKEGLQDVHLNEWNPASSGETTLKKIKEATARYLQKPEVRSQLEQCAKSLVKKRGKRAETIRWEHWAIGAEYKCPKEGCRFPHLRFPDRNELLDHLRKYHDCPPPDAAHYQMVVALLDSGRTYEE